MGMFNVATLRQSNAQNRITAAGASARWDAYNGAKPANGGAVTGANTLLARLISPTVIGTATNGVTDIDEAGITQTVANHLPGTSTFVDLTNSAGVLVSRFDVGAGAGNIQISGPIVTGQPVTFVLGATITEGNNV